MSDDQTVLRSRSCEAAEYGPDEYAGPRTRTCDAIIIGSGHNGLTLAAYLARSGWDVVVCERRHEEGGGLTSEELTEGGHLHNIHANYHTFVGLAPAYHDLELNEAKGLKYVRPDVQMASIFRDGRALTVHTDMEKTCASMARFSEKDADTFRRLMTDGKSYVDLLLQTFMYRPPTPIKELTKALVVYGVEDKSEFLSARLRAMTINDFLNKHFESDQVKVHLAFHASMCGYVNDVVGLAINVPLLIGKIDNWNLCVGGSHKLAHVLWRDLVQHGGVVLLQHAVDQIVIEDGRATGVRLWDGSEIVARKLVASSIDLEQTFLSLVGPENLPKEFVKSVNKTEHLDFSLFSTHLAMNEAPHYTAADFDPDVDRAWVVNLGFGSLEELTADWQAIRKGKLPEPRPNAAVNTLYDPTDAPPGKYTGLLRQFAPYAINPGGPGAWDQVKHSYSNRCIEAWREFAPNLASADAIIKTVPFTPYDIATKCVNMVEGDWMMGAMKPDNMLEERPFPEMAHYRTPIKNLYMCGSTQHPHGFITFGPAMNALDVIAEDHGIEKWWERV